MTTSTFWVRRNGQRELRENIDLILGDRGMSRAALCRAAGVKYSSLAGAQGGHGWLHRDYVTALAAVLEVDVAELLGDSIWPNDRARFAEFDHHPDRTPATEDDDDLAKRSRVRALCCICGAIRITDRKWPLWGDADLEVGSTRLVRTMRCASCNVDTSHALLNADRTDGRNADEAVNRNIDVGRGAHLRLQALVDRLAGFNVVVEFKRPCSKKRRAEGYAFKYRYDASRPGWCITVDPSLDAGLQHSVIEWAWARISDDQHANVDWDPRDGVLSCVPESLWRVAVEGLVDDIKIMTPVERLRMAQDVRDRLAGGAS